MRPTNHDPYHGALKLKGVTGLQDIFPIQQKSLYGCFTKFIRITLQNNSSFVEWGRYLASHRLLLSKELRTLTKVHQHLLAALDIGIIFRLWFISLDPQYHSAIYLLREHSSLCDICDFHNCWPLQL